MASPRFTETAIQRIVRRMRDDNREHLNRLKVRRMLLELASDAYADGNGTGMNILPPFDKSKVLVRTPVGDLPLVAQQFASMIGANEPRVSVVPVAVDKSESTQRMDRMAADEERLRQTLWDNAGGREKQRIVTRSQVWGRVGWYFTLPRDRAWGLPDRDYLEGMQPEEIRALKDAGKATPEPIQKPDGTYAYAESGESYMERRKATARRRAVSSRSLFTLDTFGPDTVLPEWDSDGVKWAGAQVEVPSYDFGPGSAYARAHHARSGSTVDVDKYGLYYDRDQKRIIGGVTSGGEEGNRTGTNWTYTIFGSREEVYCLVSDSPDSVGTIVWYAEHDMGECPFVPVPAFWTDSKRPGGMFSSPMEKMFADAPVLAQFLTSASMVAITNGQPRWVIVSPEGKLIQDPKTGDPMTVGSEGAIGLDPRDSEIIGGTPMQLTIDDKGSILKFLEFFAERFDAGKPSPAAIGQEGSAGTPAWSTRQFIEQQLSSLQEPVDNHAAAVTTIQRMWGRCLRKASERGEIETVYAFAMPSVGTGKSGRAPKGLIEYNPADLTDAFTVEQSSQTAQSKIVKEAHGAEKYAAGLVTLRDYLEFYADEPDARRKEIELVAYDIRRLALYGDTTKIAPGSILYDFAMALRGELSLKLMANPAAAIATAEQMAMDAQGAFNDQMALMQPQDATGMASAAGVVQPGAGMPLQQTGQPGGGQIPGVMV